jgi:hypothetical protein
MDKVHNAVILGVIFMFMMLLYKTTGTKYLTADLQPIGHFEAG